MQSLNQTNKFHFWLLACLVIFVSGLWLGIAWPQLKSWRFHQVDKLLQAAGDNNEQKFALTNQAAVLGFDDSIATEALAQAYWQAGDYGSTIQTYQTSLVNTNPLYLAKISLQAHEVGLANIYFELANKRGETAESQAGLAIVSFVNKQPEQGCRHADRASKLDLSSRVGEQAGLICTVYEGRSKLSQREQAYLLINNFIYEAGVKKLEELKEKTTSDWLILAKVNASKGGLGSAIEKLKQGLEQNPSNQELLKTIITYLQKANRGGEGESYQQRLNDTLFSKYQ